MKFTKKIKAFLAMLVITYTMTDDTVFAASIVNQIYLNPKISTSTGAEVESIWTISKTMSTVVMSFPVAALCRSAYHHMKSQINPAQK